MSYQRAYPRFPLILDVSVSSGGDVQTCQVRDYCAGGMFLLYGQYPKVIAEGSDIAIQFTNPENPSENYQLAGKVARSLEQGLGVSLNQPSPTAMMMLAHLSEKQAAESQPAGGPLSDDAVAMIRRCREIGMESIEKIVQDFFYTANERLFNAAEQSTSNLQQNAFFGAINELVKGKERLSSSIISTMEDRFSVLDKPGYVAPSIAPESKVKDEDDLSLVDNQEFDNWLVVRSVATKIEGFMPDDLEALEARFAAIATNRIDKESNPIGPLTLAAVLNQAITTMTLEDVAKKALLLVLEGVLYHELPKLYDDINSMLLEHGVLPELKKKFEVVKKQGAGPKGGHAEPVAEEPVEETQEDVAGEEGVMPTGGAYPGGAPMPQRAASTAPQAMPGGAAPQQAVPQQQAAPQQPQPPVQPAAQQAAAQQPVTPHAVPQQPAVTGPAAPQIRYNRPAAAATGTAAQQPVEPVMPYQEMQNLMHLGGEAEAAPPPEGYFSSGEVMQALAHLEGAVAAAERAELDAVGHAEYLAEILSNLTGEAGKGLSEADRDTVSYVGGLFSHMHQDQHLPNVAKPWLEQIEIPLLKAGVIDPSMLEDADHPARQVVNRLEQVGRHVESDTSEEGEEVHQQVEDLLEAIQKRVDEDPDVFSEVVAGLDGIREGYSAKYRSRVDVIVNECQQESDLNKVRDEILHALNELLGHREVPKVILKLLESGYKNLLFGTYVKNGPESEAYQSYISYIDLLTARLAKREPVNAKQLASDDKLLMWLPRMLAKASKDEEKNEELVNEVKKCISGEATPEMQFVPALIVKSGHLDEVNSKPEDVDMEDWQLILDDAKIIDDGESFLYNDEEKGEQEVTLVWHGEDDKPPRYVFADNSGEKALDVSLGEMAKLLFHNVLARMEVRELSVTERATYDFLQNIQNNLTHHAEHDELTGLLNRKSFERALEKAYNEAIATESSGVLGYFDLDRFNIINTTCGHSEGDKLLQELAEIFKVNAGENATIARLGGDEFGVILEGASRVEGLKRISAMHDEIREVRFSCEDNEFNVTASVGLAEINNTIDSSGRLLSAVDAACFTAKDQGRDNIQIHNPENTRISSRTNILEWVGRINVMFEKNLIQLRCQKIEPVQKTVNSLPHYEVLLDVHDDEGNRVPLDEFIVAAERYNRIVDIDTWVVDYVLDWLVKHNSKLTRINGVSINLSGSSIGNRRFMEHIESRLSESGFPSEKVIFEVTETIAINNLENAARFMRKIKETGVQFSLDDFGSGTSSYSYLKSLPIDYLKIDGAFVKDVAKNTNDYAVVKSINEIGHVMGKKTVAEYVEDEFAYQALKAIGLDYVQGFGVEKPIPLFKLFGE